MGFLLLMNASKRHKKNPFPEGSFFVYLYLFIRLSGYVVNELLCSTSA